MEKTAKAVPHRKINEMKFGTFKRFLKDLGYKYARTRGTSHHIFKHQETNRQIMVVSKHGLTVHPKTVTIALHELNVTTAQFSAWKVGQ